MTLGITPKTSGEEHDARGLAGEAATPFEAMRRRRAQLEQAQMQTFPVPGYQDLPIDEADDAARGTLIARFERLSADDFQHALFGPAESTLARNAQFLIDALVGLFWEVDEQLLPLLPDGDAGWHDLAAEIVDLGPQATAHQQLLAIFGDDELELADFAGDVARWMKAGHQAVDAAFLGGR